MKYVGEVWPRSQKYDEKYGKYYDYNNLCVTLQKDESDDEDDELASICTLHSFGFVDGSIEIEFDLSKLSNQRVRHIIIDFRDRDTLRGGSTSAEIGAAIEELRLYFKHMILNKDEILSTAS